MGYNLQAFFCASADATILTSHFAKAIKIDLEQNIALIPVSEELYDEINNLKFSPAIDKFSYLTENVEQEILSVIGGRKFAYVEADYSGGNGGQIAMVWEKGRRERFFSFGQNAINQTLSVFGVTADLGQDEFSALRLNRHRHTIDWIEDAV